MFRTILVPLDGSSLAQGALAYAEALARPTGARLILVRAVLARAVPGADVDRRQREALDEAQRYLAGLAVRLGEQGLGVETATPYGEAAEAILEQVCLSGADLVVMATHGRSGLGRWVYGSVAEAVLTRSPVPVLLVRSWHMQARLSSFGERPRLLVPLDGSPFAEAALPVAQSLAQTLGGQLVLLHVVPPGERVLTARGEVVAYLAYGRAAAQMEHRVEAHRAQATAGLQQVAERLAPGGSQVQIDVWVGEPGDAIAAASHEHEAALVVMATHGRTGLTRLLHGSVAASALRHGSVPLLLVRPPALAPVGGSASLAEGGPAGPGLTLTLSEDEVVLLRTALQTLGQTVSRQHLRDRIHHLLRRLSQEEAPAAVGVAAGPTNGVKE